MNISILAKVALLATLFLAPLSAEETKEEQKCNAAYNSCTEKCEKNGSSESCMDKCDEKYDDCLEAAESKTKDSD